MRPRRRLMGPAGRSSSPSAASLGGRPMSTRTSTPSSPRRGRSPDRAALHHFGQRASRHAASLNKGILVRAVVSDPERQDVQGDGIWERDAGRLSCGGAGAPPGRAGGRRWELAQWLWPLLAPVGLGLVIAGGESWADPAIVSPNGLPVQVNPTFPEPGLPAFSFPQGGLSDTGGVAGAVTIGGGSGSGSGSGADSASLGSYSGTGSGVAGAIVATGYADLLGQNVGTGECVALAQATSDVGYTSTWSPGAQVQGDTDIAVGTVIATFGSDGTYTNTYGQSHTAIYLGQDNSNGIYVEDQWLGQAAQVRQIAWTTRTLTNRGANSMLSRTIEAFAIAAVVAAAAWGTASAEEFCHRGVPHINLEEGHFSPPATLAPRRADVACGWAVEGAKVASS